MRRGVRIWAAITRRLVARYPSPPCPRPATAETKATAMPDTVPFIPVVIGREVRHTTFPTPRGELQGYQLRFQLGAPQADGSEVVTWTDWLHLPDPLMLMLTESLDAYMRSEGHLKEVRKAA